MGDGYGLTGSGETRTLSPKKQQQRQHLLPLLGYCSRPALLAGGRRQPAGGKPGRRRRFRSPKERERVRERKTERGEKRKQRKEKKRKEKKEEEEEERGFLAWGCAWWRRSGCAWWRRSWPGRGLGSRRPAVAPDAPGLAAGQGSSSSPLWEELYRERGRDREGAREREKKRERLERDRV